MSTLVLLLGTSFNIILCFSNNLAYLPNALQYSRCIYQRGQSFPRSSFYTIQPGWTVSSVFGPSIVSVDNNFNWKNAPVTNPVTNLTVNKPTFFTCSQLKPRWSNNTNKQLANILHWLANMFNFNQIPSPNTNSRGTKACIPNTFSDTEPNKLNNFLFQ